jgi:hypothetical protein
VEISRLTFRSISKTLNAAIFLLGTAILTSVCGSAQTKISGTYVACESNDGAMLQLTQATGGQITGVVSVVELDSSGGVKADTSSITGGTLDGAQLTLTLHPGMFGTNISGTRTVNTIRLQSVDREGRVSSSVFTRGSVSGFSTCTDQLRQKSAIIEMNSNLSSQIRQFSQTAHDAEAWIQNAQLHASRIPTAEGHYNQIQDKMQKLVERERSIPDRVDRSQLSNDVNQTSIDGDLFDIDVNQTWEWPIEGQLKTITQQFANCAAICTQRAAERPGIEPSTRDKWEGGCRNILAEQSNFQSIAQKVMEQRSELKTYQAKAKSLRETTVKQANGLAQ